jgi:hypothetical protein
MLEHASIKEFDWQFRGGTLKLRAETAANRDRAIIQILRKCSRRAEKNGKHTMVWSNEAFFDAAPMILPALKQLKSEIDIQVLAYVRRHDKWVKSAYTQWGIKQKMYEGPLLSFHDWLKQSNFDFYGNRSETPGVAAKADTSFAGVANASPDSPRYFFPRLDCWSQADPSWLVVRNFDAHGDVVKDFLNWAGVVETGIRVIRTNESPTDAILALWALHNAQSEEKVHAKEFQSVLARANMLEHQQIDAPRLATLLPSSTDLEAFSVEMTEDRNQVNHLLMQAGEPPLQVGNLRVDTTDVSDLQLLAGLVRIAGQQQKEIIDLRREIQKLRRSVKTQAEVIAGAPVTGATAPKAAGSATPAKPEVDSLSNKG